MVGHDDVDDICDVRPRVWPPADSCPDGTMILRATDFDFDIINRTRPSPARLVSMPHGTATHVHTAGSHAQSSLRTLSSRPERHRRVAEWQLKPNAPWRALCASMA
jgi:hypothetical protein